MANALYIWLMVMYTALAGYSVMFALTIKDAEIENLSLLHRIVRWHGIGFMVALVAAAVLSLAGIGVVVVLQNL